MTHDSKQQAENALKLLLLLGCTMMWVAAIGYAVTK